jgi:beta-1,4-mannosyltransferase
LPMRLDGASLVACLDRADLIVLPFRKTLNSGSALMAMNFGKHVVLPAIGSMLSLQRDVGMDAVTLFEGSFDATILRTAIDRVRTNNFVAPNLAEYEWPRLGAQMTEYYRQLAARPRSRGKLAGTDAQG